MIITLLVIIILLMLAGPIGWLLGFILTIVLYGTAGAILVEVIDQLKGLPWNYICWLLLSICVTSVIFDKAKDQS